MNASRGTQLPGAGRVPDPGKRAIARMAARVIAAALALAMTGQAQAADKVLRLQMLSDVEVLDPARAGSLSTIYTIAPLYHQLLTYDYLARPVKLIPYAAEALP